jgi:hypothetical protein
MEYTSNLEIGQKILFMPMERHCNKYGIEKAKGYGTITAVKFTKAKVFYDIVDEYWGFLFDSVDSSNVFEIVKVELTEE